MTEERSIIIYFLIIGVLIAAMGAYFAGSREAPSTNGREFDPDDATYFYVLAYTVGGDVATASRLTSKQCRWAKSQVQKQGGWQAVCVPVPWVPPTAPKDSPHPH
ncbi:MAG: hypothetical protein ACRECF_05445 [Methyloceanibacter sp.]